MFYSYILFLVVFYINLFILCLDEEFEKIEYPQDIIKIKYYYPNTIDKKYLYKHVGKPILQDLIISVKIQENEKKEKILVLPKKRNFMKIKGNWSEYPKEKDNMICLVFIYKKKLLKDKELRCPDDIFNSNDLYKECYKENNYSIRNLFLYIEISQTYIKKLFTLFNIPVLINVDNSLVYLTNEKKNPKEEKQNLDLHLCYKSHEEPPLYLGKIIFNSYPLNINKNIEAYDIIYTKSFLTYNWDYNIFVKGDYITIHNRIVFIVFPKYEKQIKCAPFWNDGVMGVGALNKIKKKDKNNSSSGIVEYYISDDVPDKYYIPFIKKDNLQTNNKYLICLYSDENDFEGMEFRVVKLFYSTTDSLVSIFLIIFIIIFIPLIFSLTYLFAVMKIHILKTKIQKLQLLNRKEEIEETLKKELDLDQYETI